MAIRVVLARMGPTVPTPKIHQGIRILIQEIQIAITAPLELMAPMTLAALVAVTTQERAVDREALEVVLAHRSVFRNKERNNDT